LRKNNFQEDKIIYELTEDVNEIVVNDPIEIIPVNEIDGTDIKKSGFDNYEKQKKGEKIFTDEKNVDPTPLNSSIADGLSRRTDSRKIKLKEFNYNFSKAKRMSDMENEPAFKRAGVELKKSTSTDKSRTIVSEDSEGEINLRTNNSFLHDNVD